MRPGQAHPERSLTRRLAWRLGAVMLAAIAFAGAAVAWRTVVTVRSLDDAALQTQAQLLAGQISAGPDGLPIVNLTGALARQFSTGDGESLYIVYDGGQAAVASSDPRAPDLVRPYLPTHFGFFRVGASPAYPDGLLGVVIPSGPWRVVVAQAQEQTEALVDSLLQEFLASAFWLLLPLAGAIVLVGVLTIRSGLRPLRDASAAARRVGGDKPGVRLPTLGLPRELAPLVGAVNQALQRLERTLEGQRRFVASAAHALRTPLAVLSARVDALPAGGQVDALREDADRMARLVGQLLSIARLEDLPLDCSGSLDLRRAAVNAISDLAPVAIRQGVELTLSGSGKLEPVPGNHSAAVAALTNLLENALAYAPAGSAVEVVLSSPATARVLDRGPGVPEAERAAIFGRFQRGRGARPGGSGLGLAIVADIAAAHRGAAWVEPREGGGSTFVLRLAPR